MTKRKFGWAFIGLSALLLAAPVAADITITLRGIDDGKQTLIEVRNGVARMGKQGASGYSLYDKVHDRFIVVEERDGTYLEIDRAMLRQMSTQMAGMQDMVTAQRERLRAQLQNVPAEQRAMMEAQMARMMDAPPAGAAAGQRLRGEPRGERLVAGVDCRAYALFDGIRKAADVCMAMAGNAAFPAADYATLTAMLDFMRVMARAAPRVGEAVDPLMMSDLQGVPLELRGAVSGDDFTLQSLSRDELDAARFEAYKALRRLNPLQDAMAGGLPGRMPGEAADFMMTPPP